jgi:hypothetical protein
MNIESATNESKNEKLFISLIIADVWGVVLILCFGYVGVKSILVKEKRWIALICFIQLISLSCFIVFSQLNCKCRLNLIESHNIFDCTTAE